MSSPSQKEAEEKKGTNASPELIIIGTSHVSKSSIEKVKRVIREKKPDVVAVELDKQRFFSLYKKQQETPSAFKTMRRIGIKSFLFLSIARTVQKKIGKAIGILPGSEMKQAVEVAVEIQAKVALVDQDISITAKRLNGVLGITVWLKMLQDGFLGIFKRGQAYHLLSRFNIDAPSQKNIEDALQYLRLVFPGLYRVIVEERDNVIFSNVKKILEKEQSVVLVVGAAHEKGIRKLMEEHMKK